MILEILSEGLELVTHTHVIQGPISWYYKMVCKMVLFRYLNLLHFMLQVYLWREYDKKMIHDGVNTCGTILLTLQFLMT